tara:strand:- start:837 stop:1001 length:165 start_codon:yes stop_codon:yes gene_type:complete
VSKIIEDVLEKIELTDKIATLEARLSVLQRSAVRDEGALWGKFFKKSQGESNDK